MERVPFRDRLEGGCRLAEALDSLDLRRPLVLGIPRGGVHVAAPVAGAFSGELDVMVVRKIGAPGNPELGIGAVAAEGDPVVDDRLLQSLGVTDEYLRREVEAQREEVRRRLAAYRGGDETHPPVAGRDVVVVDDGIATGGTVTAAGRLLRAWAPATLVLGVPVAPRDAVQRLEGVYDHVVCVATPEPYLAVGQWYRDFHQVTDDEVRDLLRRARDTAS